MWCRLEKFEERMLRDVRDTKSEEERKLVRQERVLLRTRREEETS